MKNSGGNKPITSAKNQVTDLNNFSDFNNNNNNFSIKINFNDLSLNKNKSKEIIFTSKKLSSKEKIKKKEENSISKIKTKNSKKHTKLNDKKRKICLDSSSEDDSKISFNLNLNEDNEKMNSKNNNKEEVEIEIKREIPELDVAELVKCLTCPLCDGIFRNPYTISECMDTFCKRCILKSKDENPKKFLCPICNIDLNAKVLDGLMPNSQLNFIINSFFPEFEEIDKADKIAFYKFFRDHKKRLHNEEKENPDSLLIQLTAYRHENPLLTLPSLKNQILKVNKDITVKEIKNFIYSKLNQKGIDIELTFKSMETNDNQTLSEILTKKGTQTLNDSNLDMVMFYFKKGVKETIKGNQIIKKEDS